MTDLGTYIDHEGKPAVRFERVYPHSIDRVWTAVTEADDLGKWFPSGVTHQGKVGGAIEFAGDPYSDVSSGTILEFEPKTRFGFTWGPDEVHMTLEDLGGSCRFVLVNVLEAADAAARNASGWTVCLSELDKVLAGERSDGPHSDAASAGFEDIMATYIAAGMPAGAAIPGVRSPEEGD